MIKNNLMLEPGLKELSVPKQKQNLQTLFKNYGL